MLAMLPVTLSPAPAVSSPANAAVEFPVRAPPMAPAPPTFRGAGGRGEALSGDGAAKDSV